MNAEPLDQASIETMAKFIESDSYLGSQAASMLRAVASTLLMWEKKVETRDRELERLRVELETSKQHWIEDDRDLNELLAENEHLQKLILMFRQWDVLDTSGDGAHWKRKIDEAISSCAEKVISPAAADRKISWEDSKGDFV